MLLRYFYDSKLAQASYLVGCQATGEAIVLDPARDITPYLRASEEQGLRLVAAAETHIHADFVSGARELSARTGATLYLSDEGGEEWAYQQLDGWPHQLLKDGATFKIGNLRFEAMHTPGHTPEHLAFLLTDAANADEPMGIFSGDFVFVGSVGRPDLLEQAAGVGGSAEKLAHEMFHSLQRFKKLPDFLQLWPGHGAGSACGKGLGAVPSSTVGYEKLFNWALQSEEEDAFVHELLAGQPEPPTYFAQMKRINKEGPRVLGDTLPLQRLPMERLAEVLDEGAMVVDTRPADAYATRHVPGTINIPYGGSFLTWAGWLLPYDAPFYLIVEADQAEAAVEDLAAIGLEQVTGYFDLTVVDQWASSGHEVQQYEVEPAEKMAERVRRGEVTVVDVRAQSEWEEGHLPDAHHVMLGYLPERVDELPRDKPILVHCLSGARSAIAASILQAQGVEQVINLQGGFGAWKRAGLPIVNGQEPQS